MNRSAALVALIVLLLAGPADAGQRYEPRRTGHPLRIVAYALHPAGWLLDRLIFFPAWWIGGHEPLRSIFGHEGLPEHRTRPVAPVEPQPAEPALEPDEIE